MKKEIKLGGKVMYNGKTYIIEGFWGREGRRTLLLRIDSVKMSFKEYEVSESEITII